MTATGSTSCEATDQPPPATSVAVPGSQPSATTKTLVRISTCSCVAYAPRIFRATSPGENSLRVKTRNDTTSSVRSRNARCLSRNRATVSATLPLSDGAVNGAGCQKPSLNVPLWEEGRLSPVRKQGGVGREISAPETEGEQRRAAGARRVRHIRRVIDGRGQRLSTPRSRSHPPLAVRGQRVVDLGCRMLVPRVVGPRPEEKHAESQLRIDGDCRRSVGGSDDDGIAVIVEKPRTGRVAPVVWILRPGQRRPELPKGRDEGLRRTAHCRVQDTLPEPADGKTLR